MPLLIQGQYGQGRSHLVRSYIRQKECSKDYKPFSEELYLGRCNCMSCVKIVKKKTHDVLVLEGTEGIAEARDVLALFNDTRPAEFSKKYLLLKNIDYFSKPILDAALKLVEEPKQDQEIFATMQPTSQVSGAFQSRFIVLELPYWSQDQLQHLCEHFEVFKPFRSYLDQAEIATPYQLTTFPSVTRPVTQEWYNATSVPALLDALEKTKKWIDASPAPNMSILACLKHYVWGLRQLKNPTLSAYVNRVELNHNSMLLRYAGRVNSSFQMNLDNQLFSFLMAILLVRKKLKC